MRDVLSQLNPEQRAAVTAPPGPLLVLAGAGSGKTRVITARIAWLLSRGVSPESVLAVTFTNKAAVEMRERVAKLVGAERASGLTVGTFHSFCARLLREHAERAGLAARFTICDASDQQAALRGALRELCIPGAAMRPSELAARISLAKSRGQSSEAFLAGADGDEAELVGRAWQRYDEHLARARSVDFDDLLLRTERLLRTDDGVRAALARRFKNVLVDEYQDTNGPQYDIVRAIAGEHRNLCVVGDDDQSIYGWRGADVANILGFERDFPGARVVRLETNYRSTGAILEAANKVIAHNPGRLGKTLRSARGTGDAVVTLRMEDEEAEADHVAREIAELVRQKRCRYADCAVLFRTQTQPRAFEQQFRARSVPYVLTGGMSFFDRKEVRDVLAYLRLAHNPRDEVSLLRVINAPPRGIGRTTLERVVAHATKLGITANEAFERTEAIEGVPEAASQAARALLAEVARLGAEDPRAGLAAWARRLVDAVGYRSEVDRCYPDAATRDDRWKSVEEVYEMAESFVRRSRRATLPAFLEALALSADDERGDERREKRDAVALMTIHAAKGLEFPRVWLVGVEEGLLPHRRSAAEDGVEEERRLCYVAITRAQDQLTISCTKQRTRYGAHAESMPSRFLYELLGEKPPAGWQACGAPSVVPAKKSKRGSTAAQRKRSKTAPRRGARYGV